MATLLLLVMRVKILFAVAWEIVYSRPQSFTLSALQRSACCYHMFKPFLILIHPRHVLKFYWAVTHATMPFFFFWFGFLVVWLFVCF